MPAEISAIGQLTLEIPWYTNISPSLDYPTLSLSLYGSEKTALFHVLGIGTFALTGLHHTSAPPHRTNMNRYELYAMCTHAVSIWDWLSDAALSVGYDIYMGESQCPQQTVI